MIFGAWKSRSEAPKPIFWQMIDLQKLKKFSRIAMALIFFPVKADISYFLNMYKTELKTELQRVNFVLTEISSIWILLEFWRYFCPQGYMSSVLSSVHVCRNVRISYLIQSKAQKWSFKCSVFFFQRGIDGGKNFEKFDKSPVPRMFDGELAGKKISPLTRWRENTVRPFARWYTLVASSVLHILQTFTNHEGGEVIWHPR